MAAQVDTKKKEPSPDGTTLQILRDWIKEVPFSRPMRHVSRDFADGVCVAEILHHFIPRSVDLHNYVTASGTEQKLSNWDTLNRKVFSKMNMHLNDNMITQIVHSEPGAVEKFLLSLRSKIMDPATPKLVVATSRRDLSVVRTNSRITSVASVSSMQMPKPIPKSTLPAIRVSALKLRNSNTMMIRPPLPNPNNVSPTPTWGPPPPVPRSYSALIMDPKQSQHANLDFSSRSQMEMASPDPNTTNSTPHPPAIKSEESLQTGFNGCENIVTEVEGFVMYGGQKMVSADILEESDRRLKQQENEKRVMSIKIERLQRLVEIKDARISELVHQIDTMKGMIGNSLNDLNENLIR